MADFFGIFTGKNDLAKFLAIGGLFCFIFSMMYPVEKRKELDLSITELNIEIVELEEFCKKTIDKSNSLKLLRDSLLIIADGGIGNQSEEIHSKLEEIKLYAKSSKAEVISSRKIIKKKEARIEVLEVYVSEYSKYVNALYFGGLVAMLLGFISWGISGYSEHKRLNK